jgi:hypothetical protein
VLRTRPHWTRAYEYDHDRGRYEDIDIVMTFQHDADNANS